ncbi:MAG: hypothetical protein RLZZ76_52 [Candidatus Parcubacteria bacterium]
MQVLFAVIDDLFEFAYTALFGATTIEVQSVPARLLSAPQVSEQPMLPTFSSVGSLLEERASTEEVILSGDSSFFIGEENVFLFYEPTFAFDSAICLIHYGTQVHVRKLGGRWAHVGSVVGEGWILKDALRKESTDVFPTLAPEAAYTHDHKEVQKLRLCIGDEFSGERSGLLLQDTEFVTYRQGRRGRKIPWTGERPRVAGEWQRLLRGKQGVHMSIVPKEGTIMEYTSDEEGHLAFVEAVFPDQSISISSVGLMSEGEYTQAVLTHDTWKELRPVFISIS